MIYKINSAVAWYFTLIWATPFISAGRFASSPYSWKLCHYWRWEIHYHSMGYYNGEGCHMRLLRGSCRYGCTVFTTKIYEDKVKLWPLQNNRCELTEILWKLDSGARCDSCERTNDWSNSACSLEPRCIL